MNQKIIILLAISLLTLTGFAQSISGSVLDKTTGAPLIGASVYIENSFRGAITDRDGKYMIPSTGKGSFKVTATYLGYESMSEYFEIKGRIAANIVFKLPQISIEQNEIVVAGVKTTKIQSIPTLTTTILGEVTLKQTSETNIMPLLSSKIPGLFVTQRGYGGFGVADGAAGKMSIRGIGSTEQSQVLITIDGQPQAMGIFGHAFPDMYNTSEYQRVEVIRGPASILYGGNAMGGVVNLITNEPDSAGIRASLSSHYGSFGTVRISPTISYRKANFSMATGYTRDQTDGDRPNARYKSDHGHLKMGWQFNKNLDLTFSSSVSNIFSVDPGPITNPDEYANEKHWAKVKRGNAQVSFKNNYEKLSGHFNVFYNQGNHDIYTNWKSIDRNYGISAYENFSLIKNNLFGIGFDWNRYGGQGNTVEPFDNWIDVTETGAYAFMQQTLFNKLSINAGARFQNHSVYGGKLIPEMGAIYKIDDRQSVKLTASKGFRSPNVKELYFFPTSNTSLKPEELWSYETGYTRYLLDHKLKTSLTAFYIKGSNSIQLVRNTDPFPPFKFQNSGNFQHWGAEWEATYRAKPNLLIESSYSFLHTDVARLGAPKHQLYLGTTYTLNRFDFNVSAQGISGLYSSIATGNEIQETYITVNSRINCRAGRFLSVFVAGNNLLNWKYQINDGYPMPGISFLGGMRKKSIRK